MDADRHFGQSSEAVETLPRVAAFLARLYLPLLSVLIAVWTWRPLTGAEDFWAHAAVGRWIWENNGVPRQTLWLWSAPPEKWIAHGWLSELIFYGLMQAGGAHLVLLATIVFVAAPFYWAWKLWAKNGRLNAFTPLFFAWAIWCASIRFQPRPELFSYFFLGLLLLFLAEPKREISPAKACGVLALFAIWANCHGAVALGLLILFLTAGTEFLQQKGARPSRQLVGLAIGCALAINLNPYGLEYWRVLRPVGGAMFQMIDEWKPPYVAPALPPEAIAFVLAIAGIAFLMWLQNPARRWSQVLWLLLACALFLSARRNLWPFVLICLFVAACNAAAFRDLRFPFAGMRWQVLARAFAVLCLIGWMALAVSPFALSSSTGVLALRAVAPILPSGVADYVLTKNPPSPIFNDYLRSGYFHWRFAGRRELFIDLHNVYPPSLLADYFAIIKRTPEGIQKWERLKVNTVIFGSHRATDRLAPLDNFLTHSPQWQRVYHAADGTVWVRRNAAK